VRGVSGKRRFKQAFQGKAFQQQDQQRIAAAPNRKSEFIRGLLMLYLKRLSLKRFLENVSS